VSSKEYIFIAARFAQNELITFARRRHSINTASEILKMFI
jgi:hypothetical protein